MRVLLSKSARYASKMFGNRGTDIAGRIGMMIDKKMLRKLANQVDKIIVITGTNGKTTTSNLIAAIIKQKEENIIHNNEGANLVTGVLTSFINKTNLWGKIKSTYAILEVDEGSIPEVLKHLTPNYIVITNFFRDQLDRYGEIDILINNIQEAISKKSETKLILNGDDPFCMRFYKEGTTTFGVNPKANTFLESQVTESKYCPRCNRELNYKYTYYGQLGVYSCECGFKREEINYEVEKIEPNSLQVNQINYQHNLPGKYNVYNIAASISVAKKLDIENEDIENGLKNYHSQDGRMHLFTTNNQGHLLNLVKNPIGMNVSLQELTQNNYYKHIHFILNDKVLDGHDVSWIWDADFEILEAINVEKYYVSGLRAHDMKIRLLVAGIPEAKIKLCNDTEQIIDEVVSKNSYTIASYTALQSTKQLLEKRFENEA